MTSTPSTSARPSSAASLQAALGDARHPVERRGSRQAVRRGVRDVGARCAGHGALRRRAWADGRSARETGPGALPLGQHTIVAHTAGVPVEPLNRTAYVGAGTTWQRVMDAATPYVLSALVTLIGGTLVLCGVVLAVGVVGFLAAAG